MDQLFVKSENSGNNSRRRAYRFRERYCVGAGFLSPSNQLHDFLLSALFSEGWEKKKNRQIRTEMVANLRI